LLRPAGILDCAVGNAFEQRKEGHAFGQVKIPNTSGKIDLHGGGKPEKLRPRNRADEKNTAKAIFSPRPSQRIVRSGAVRRQLSLIPVLRMWFFAYVRKRLLLLLRRQVLAESHAPVLDPLGLFGLSTQAFTLAS
jgi:hypothetical protein